MPVVNLPQDTRWGDLGKAAGQAGGALIGQMYQQHLAQGVGEILQDPGIAEDKKGIEALKRFGDAGYLMYQQQVKTQATQAQIKEALAATKLNEVRTQAETAKVPYAGPTAAAGVEATQARTGLEKAETAKTTALLPGEIQAQGVANALGASRNVLTQAQAVKEGAEGELVGLQVNRYKQILEGLTTSTGGVAPQTLDKMLDDAGITDTAQRAVAKQAYAAQAYSTDPSKAPDAFVKEVGRIVNTKAGATIRSQMPNEAETKFASDQAQHATSAKAFIDEFAKKPTEVGLLSGATLKTWLERHGIGSGDPEVVSLWNAAQQQVSSQATSGGGFFAQGRVRLAQDVVPTITETPLHAAIAADQVADRQIAALQVRIQDHPEQKSLQTALDKWQDVKKVTGSLAADKLAPYQVTIQKPDGSQSTMTVNSANKDTPPAIGSDYGGGKITAAQPWGDEKSVVYFNGNQVDPKTFKTLVAGDRTYTTAQGQRVRGSDIITSARQNSLSATDLLERLGAK